MRIHWIQHVAFETLGNINEWVLENNHSLTCTQQFNNDTLPEIEDFDMLIIMGGPMGVYDTDQYPWLATELNFIKDVIESNKPVLGICLGSQFIAAALGAKVYPGPVKEIGWFPIQIFNPKILSFNQDNPVVFHWHGDTFDLPKGAQLLASTPEVPNQAYIYKNAIGLQFHIEQTEATIKEMLHYCGDELKENGTKMQDAEKIINTKEHFITFNEVMSRLLDYLKALSTVQRAQS